MPYRVFFRVLCFLRGFAEKWKLKLDVFRERKLFSVYEENEMEGQKVWVRIRKGKREVKGDGEYFNYWI